jgi:hypothetical protein
MFSIANPFQGNNPRKNAGRAAECQERFRTSIEE